MWEVGSSGEHAEDGRSANPLSLTSTSKLTQNWTKKMKGQGSREFGEDSILGREKSETSLPTGLRLVSLPVAEKKLDFIFLGNITENCQKIEE